MHYTKHTISSFIYHADIMVKNSRDVDAIRNAVGQYGYGEPEMDKGNRLLADLRQVTLKQHSAKSEKAKNFSRKQHLQMKIHKVYMKYLTIARIAFADDVKARRALVLDGVRGRRYNMWVFQVGSFCSIMLENDDDYLAVIRKYGISKNDIEQLKAQLAELNILSDRCLKSVGEVRKLTALRQQKVIEMQHYVSDFLKIARIALECTPQLLESLGVSVKS